MKDRKIERLLEAIAKASEEARQELMIAESELIRIGAITETLSRVNDENLSYWTKQLNSLKLETSERVNSAARTMTDMNKNIAAVTALAVKLKTIPNETQSNDAPTSEL